MDKLGKSQSTIFDYLKQEIRQKGYPPSVREICQAVGLNSTSTVHEHLNQLEKKGYIKRDPTKPRAIEILEPDFYSYRRELIEIPIIGKVTAGEPILAVENIEGVFPVPSEFVKGNDVFMLRVQGQSMIEAGILDKDLIMVRKQPVASNGEIVVALLDDSATVKRYFKEKNHFRLQPENSAMNPIIVKDVSIIGVVVGLFRIY